MQTLLFILALQAVSADRISDPDIVVSAPRLQEYQRSLMACIARHCPPKDEIERSLAYADAQMVAGDYEGSRQTLMRARHRNARYATTQPIVVADLHRALSRLAGLNGSRAASQAGMFDVVDALKAGLSPHDERLMAARLEVGDTFARSGRFEGAISHYRWVAKLARKANLPSIEGRAMFREASLLAIMADVYPSYYGARARHVAALVLQRRDPDWAPLRNAMRFVPVQLASEKDRAAALEAATAALEPVASADPQLLYAPRANLANADFGAASGSTQPEWGDVAFRIGAAGEVDDVTIVRRSAHLPDQWLNLVVEALRARRYAPSVPLKGRGRERRVERFAFVSDLIADKQSRIPIRNARRRLDIIDLTPPAPDTARDAQDEKIDRQ